ncbi:MAG: AMP-binding protein [Streptosporangiaceae bacterium]
MTSALGSGNDPFQPSVIPFNIGAITCGYLAGVVLVQPWRSRLTKTLVRVGSDDAYGIYLSQMLFVSLLISFGWGRLNSVLPWPVVCLLAVGVIFACCITLTTLLARTPLAVPLTGRKQQPWSTLIPRRTPTRTTAARTTAARTTAARTAPDQRQERSSALISEWIAQAADQRGSAPYLEDAAGGETVSYAELRQATRAWARRLDRAGIVPGGAVAIRWPDPLGYATALVAILGAGRVAVPLDPAAPAAELARVLAVARPEAVVAASAEGLPPGLAVLGPPAEPDRADGAADRSTDGAAGTDGGTDGAAGTGGIFLCTSGTTGTPKGILLSQDQLAHVAAAVAGHHRLTPADRGYCCLPLFHVNAEVVGLLATLAARACLVVDRKFSRRGFWALIGERRITWINAVPAIIAVLAMDPPEERVGGRIRFVRSASAPLPPSTLRRFEEAFDIPVVETYGMTEAASMITANPVDGPRKPGSAGRAAGAEVRVAERAGSGYLPCPAGTVGRVQIRGRGVIRAYASGAPAGAIDPDGWLDTGDLGHLDQDGYLFLAGRSDDVINRGGEKIYPGEIEDFLLTQPGVGSVAVVAARDEVLGYCPVAYVVPAGSGRDRKPEHAEPEHAELEHAELEAALREACAAALARAKQPSAFYLVQELPLGPTGKVARRRLRELAAAS